MTREPHPWDPVCKPPRDLFRPVPLDPTGRKGPTRGRARSRAWRQSTRGFYVPSWVDPHVPEQRILEQAVRLPDGGAVTGWAACRMHGASFFDGLGPDGATELPVPLCTGGSALRTAPGGVVSRTRLPPGEVRAVRGVPCTVRARAVFDAMRTAVDLRQAVVDFDMAAAAELVSLSQLSRYVEEHPAWDGVDQVRRALALGSEDSRSPYETRMRLIWELDAGLPRPLCNRPVWTLSGRLLGTPDLFDEEAGVVGEYDGAEHRHGARHSRDVAREDQFRRHGLEYFKITGRDMRSPELVVDRMLSTRARALWLPPGRRTWTLAPPPESEPELTLDERWELQALLHGWAAAGDPPPD